MLCYVSGAQVAASPASVAGEALYWKIQNIWRTPTSIGTERSLFWPAFATDPHTSLPCKKNEDFSWEFRNLETQMYVVEEKQGRGAISKGLLLYFFN